MSAEQYSYREGVHGEHCVDIGSVQFVRSETIARAATKEDAERMVDHLNGLRLQPTTLSFEDLEKIRKVIRTYDHLCPRIRDSRPWSKNSVTWQDINDVTQDAISLMRTIVNRSFKE